MDRQEAIKGLKNLFSEHELSLPNTDSLEILNMAIAALERMDAEEQGLLIKLPCKVGDKVFTLWSCGRNGKSIAEFEIKHVDIDFLPEIEFAYAKANSKSGSYWFYKATDIGKTVFLTREEAERALERKKHD